MVTGHVFIATSLDGFVARADHRLDWLMKQKTEGEDHGYDAFMESVDGLVMGRGSFETVRGFDHWPYEKPVIVMSRSLVGSDVSDALKDKVRLTSMAPKEVMSGLAEDGWSRVYIDGGLLVQSFLQEGLISELIVSVAPVLIGSGIRLFGALDRDIDLDLIGQKSFESGIVQSHYRIRSNRDESVQS